MSCAKFRTIASAKALSDLQWADTAMKVVKATDQSEVLVMAAFLFLDSSLALESLAWSNWSSREFSGKLSPRTC